MERELVLPVSQLSEEHVIVEMRELRGKPAEALPACGLGDFLLIGFHCRILCKSPARKTHAGEKNSKFPHGDCSLVKAGSGLAIPAAAHCYLKLLSKMPATSSSVISQGLAG